jgi:hypothetical protein
MPLFAVTGDESAAYRHVEGKAGPSASGADGLHAPRKRSAEAVRAEGVEIRRRRVCIEIGVRV